MAGQGTPPTTLGLLEEAGAGDPVALNELLARMRPRLLAWTAARLGPLLKARLEAEDVVQEILVQAYAALPSFEARGGRSFYAWLFTIAERCIAAASDHHRAAKRDARREAALPPGVAAAQTSPSSRAARAEEWQLVLDALASLPEPHRTVFRLRRIEHRDNDEAAGILGVTPNHASVLYVRAVRALRDRLQGLDA